MKRCFYGIILVMKAVVLTAMLILVFSGCRKDPVEPANNPPYIPSNPTPADGATGQSINVVLDWTGGDPDPGDFVRYDISFGTTSPPPVVSSNLSLPIYIPGTLNYATRYYWKIVARDNHGSTATGNIWSFTTTRAHWYKQKNASGSYYDIRGNYHDPHRVHGYPWIELSSYGTDGAEAYWSFRGLNEADVETLIIRVYSYDNGWDSDGEHYYVYDNDNSRWIYWGSSDKTERWRGYFVHGNDVKRYIRNSDNAIFLEIVSGYPDHSHIKYVAIEQKGKGSKLIGKTNPFTAGYLPRPALQMPRDLGKSIARPRYLTTEVISE